MAEAANNPTPIEEEDQFQDETLSERFMDWARTELVWYAGSFTVHLLALSLLLLLGPIMTHDSQGDAPVFESQAPPAKKEPDRFKNYDPGKIEEKPPTELDVDPTLEKPAVAAQPEEKYDDNKVFEHRGGGMTNGMKDANVSGGAGALAFGPGPKVTGAQGIGVGVGLSKNYGHGGAGSGFGGRGQGHRRAMLAQNGGTKHTERAVTMALIWLANHQLSTGNWSLQNYTQRCVDKTCTGPGTVAGCDAGATAMGLLPFLAAGQTHKSSGPYKEHIGRGIAWLLQHQQPDGDLAKGAQQKMYSHGLATIALSEAYGLSGDAQVGRAAQAGVYYIIKAQNAKDGGWRYNPGDPGDTSVVGWQLMALKSAHMAGLDVGTASSGMGGGPFVGVSKWLDSVASHDGSEYSYQGGGGGTPTMSSVGLLCRQYLGVKRDNPMLTGGMAYLMGHLPDENAKNVYYWYYATQVMHNMSGYEWDTWNRKMRNLLVHTQVRDDVCARGSWDPANDQWGKAGGRVMETSLSALTLEIYYRYLPLFKAEAGGGAGNAADVATKPVLGPAGDNPPGDAGDKNAAKPDAKKPDSKTPAKKG